jgi:hypothetical protein
VFTPDSKIDSNTAPERVTVQGLELGSFSTKGFKMKKQISSSVISDAKERGKKAVGNWNKFDSFAMSDEPDARYWTVVYDSNRDSDLLGKSNAEQIRKIMAEWPRQAVPIRHSHWACGFVEGFELQVFTRKMQPTKAWIAWCQIQDALEAYPVLNADDYHERVFEDTLNNIRDVARSCGLKENPPEGWVSEVYGKLPDFETESRDGEGAYPSEQSVRKALKELDMLSFDEKIQELSGEELADLLTEEQVLFIQGNDATDTIENLCRFYGADRVQEMIDKYRAVWGATA